jgi:hypothetical protein
MSPGPKGEAPPERVSLGIPRMRIVHNVRYPGGVIDLNDKSSDMRPPSS